MSRIRLAGRSRAGADSGADRFPCPPFAIPNIVPAVSLRSLLIAVLVASLPACAPAPPDGFAPWEPDPQPTPDPTPDPGERPPWWGWADEPITALLETSNLGENPGCVQPLMGCADDYYAFPDVAAEHARPITEAELLAAIDAMLASAPPLEEPTEAGPLASALGEALNIGFLLDGLHPRPLEVRTVAITVEDGAERLDLLFVDPFVGTFHGVLWLPQDATWRAPILGVHGHATEAVDLYDGYGGDVLVAAGHPLLALDLRVNYADALEDDVQRHLLRAGFSLLEIRVYEAFLGLKYLRARGDMEPGLGVLAHSGGAGAMNVAIRLHPGIDAYAFDNTAEYACWLKDDRLLDDSVPDVHPYRALINDFGTAAPALLQQDYGFPEGPEPLLAFFADAL